MDAPRPQAPTPAPTSLPRTPNPAAIAAVDRFARRYTFPLDGFQRDAMVAFAEGLSVLVTAPTGTGKTVIAEYAIQRALDDGRRVIYTTPLRALSAQKFRDFAAVWGRDKVGMITGETAVNDRAPVLVMTTEILRNRLVSEQTATIDDLGSVVLDEFHYLADVDRGRVWEEVVLLLPRQVQLVCLSATIPNDRDVADWLRTVHGPTEVIVHDERAVPLDFWYSARGRLARVAGPDSQLISRPRIIREPREVQDRGGPTPEVLEALDERGFLPAIVFVLSRRRTEEWAAEAVASGLDLTPDEETRAAILRELDVIGGRLAGEELAEVQLEALAEALPRGLSFHHAGLVPALRELVERLFEAGLIGVVFATGTLALGVNMPARTVVLEQLQTRDDRGWRPLAKREFLQMAGRAGRRGMDILGHIIVLEHPYDSFDSLERILKQPPEPVTSAFQLDYGSALYLLDRYGADGTAELYRRSFATFVRIRQAEQTAASGAQGKGSSALLIRRKAQIERDIVLQAERLESVLGQFGYWNGRTVADRARFLRRFFHGNALLTSEAVIGGLLNGLDSQDLAEAASWLEGGGRSGRTGRKPYALPTKLGKTFRDLLGLDRRIHRIEEDAQIEVSAGLGPAANHGLILRTVRGDSLSQLCDHYGIDPGDLYARIKETEMWLRQLEGALAYSGFDDALAVTSRAARALLTARAGDVGFTPATEAVDAAEASEPEPEAML